MHVHVHSPLIFHTFVIANSVYIQGQVQFDSSGYRVWGSYIVSQMRYGI